MGYNVTALNEEITKIEQAKSNISNILYEKGRPVTNNSALSDIVSNILPLSNIRRYNTNVEKNLDKTVENGTVSMVYGPYINSDSTTIFTTNIYLPKQLSVTANDVRTLGSGTILAKLVYQSSGNDFAQIIINTVDNKYIVKLEILDYTLNIDDTIWELNTDNVYTRNDDITGYRTLNMESAVIYSTTVTTRNLAYEILQISSTYKFNGLYLYNVANWEPLPLGVTANISTIFTGKTALTDNGIVIGIGTSDATAISGDIWKKTAYVNGEKLTGTLQITQNVTREELDSKIDMWNTFTNFSTVGNNLSYLMTNLPQKLLPTITANDIVDISGMYYNCKNLIEVDITKLNTINTTNMDNTFSNCSNLDGFNLNNWKTNNLQSTRGMFDNCINVTSIDVSNWNITNLKDTTSMFENCKNLTNLNVSKWNTYNVETMPKMFKNCQHMENLSFTNWNTSNITNMEAIFESCDRFTNESIANVVNMLPDAMQLTNNNAYNLGIDMDRYNQLQLLALNQKNYIGAPLPYNMYYNIVNLDDGSYYLLNKGDDLDKSGTKLRNYLQTEYSNGMYNIKIEDNRLKDGTLTSMSSWFSYKNKYININMADINTSNVSTIVNMFYLCTNLTSIDVSNWDTSNIKNVHRVFEGCNNICELNVAGWDTTNVTDMLCMFAGCSRLTDINVSNWDTSNVTTMTWTFSRCLNLINLDVSNWDVHNVTQMSGMFENSPKLQNLDVSRWNISKATSVINMFNWCTNLTNIDVSNWNTGNVKYMYGMFNYCVNLINIDVSNWDTRNVMNMSGMFGWCSNLTNIDVSNWNTSNVTDMQSMFYACSKLVNLNLSNWDTSNVTNMGMMFSSCSNLRNLDVSNWNTSKLKTLYYTFRFCNNLENIDVSNWDTSNLSNFSGTFSNISNNVTFDISNWSTSNVTSMGSTFYGCQANIIGVENLNVSKVTNMYETFRYSGFTSLNLVNWDVSNVNYMQFTFWYMSKLTSVNISGWNTGKIKNLSLFSSCKALVNVDVSGINLTNITSITEMFASCNNLSNASIDSIINMCLNATNVIYKNLHNTNQYSPFRYTNITNTRYQNRWAELDAAGWTY